MTDGLKSARIGKALPDRADRDWVIALELINQAGISYRQLDYWCRTGLLTTLDGNTPGSGWARRFHETQVERALALRALLNVGMSLQLCRLVIDDFLRDHRVDIGAVTLIHNRAPLQEGA